VPLLRYHPADGPAHLARRAGPATADAPLPDAGGLLFWKPDGAPVTRWLAVRLVLGALTIALLMWLVAACASGRPTSLIRLRGGYEVLTAHCEARLPESCTSVHVTGDPHDEEAWGFRARPPADALWKEPEVLYAVGDRGRCDQVRAALSTPSEACWGPVYFRRR
jgi:hypothetical protein